MGLKLANQCCDLRERGFLFYAFLLKVEIHFPSARQFQTGRTSDELAKIEITGIIHLRKTTQCDRASSKIEGDDA